LSRRFGRSGLKEHGKIACENPVFEARESDPACGPGSSVRNREFRKCLGGIFSTGHVSYRLIDTEEARMND
jgi:hypothetical protein